MPLPAVLADVFCITGSSLFIYILTPQEFVFEISRFPVTLAQWVYGLLHIL